MLAVNDRIPEFFLSTESGENVSAKSLLGHRYVLYLYPKDDTPGCTTESCGFRDALPDFSKLSVKVFGLSADDEKSHQKFVSKFSLNFPLLADPQRQLIEALGAWVEKSMYGKKYMGILRSTVVVNADGLIERVWEKVSVATHAQEVLNYVNGNELDQSKPAKSKPAAKRAAKTTAGKG